MSTTEVGISCQVNEKMLSEALPSKITTLVAAMTIVEGELCSAGKEREAAVTYQSLSSPRRLSSTTCRPTEWGRYFNVPFMILALVTAQGTAALRDEERS